MPELSLSRVLSYWADRDPDRPSITYQGRTVSRAQLEASSNRLARAYAGLGVSQGDFVTIALPNGIEFFESCFATWKLGATPQPISAKLPKFERDGIIEIGKPKLIVGVEEGAYGDTPCLRFDFAPDPELSDAPLPEVTAVHFKAMTSGGSTGRPKLIVSKLPAQADTDAEYLDFVNDTSMLIPGPLYHNGPFLWSMGSLFRGCHQVVTKRFDAEQCLQLIQHHKIHTAYFVPTMMQRIWALPEEVRLSYDMSSINSIWHLAAPCPAWLKQAWMDWLGPEKVMELYGGTEGQGSTTISGTEWLAHRGSVGKPRPEFQIKIVDEDGETLPPGEVGEVFLLPVTGQGSTYHYIGAEAKAIAGGWESLGDLGYMDADGYLYLADRLTDMILSGAANIYPAEVEGALDAYPGVRSSAVIGLPHADMGNAIHAIVDAPGGDVDEAALLAHLAEHLARNKIPRTFEFVTEPLRDEAGKVRRKALREERL